MVIKYVDNKNLNDKFKQAGLKAEKQMAHYLNRAFSKSEDIIVLNDIRLQEGTEFAQIDHLIIHTFGFIIIESKSVSSKIVINSNVEWKRVFNNQEKGMPSPIEQAKRQASFLKNFLEENAKHVFRNNFVNKFLKKPTFKHYSFDILVAISDNGIIEREGIDLPNLFKADAIPDAISKLITKNKNDFKQSLINPFSADIHSFHSETIKDIGERLCNIHTPFHKDKETYQCSKCKSIHIQINGGRYGYYFKCIDCANNTPIKHTCNTLNCKPKTRKSKLQFFKVCEACNIDELFWENKP